jgi:hypothetical protein
LPLASFSAVAFQLSFVVGLAAAGFGAGLAAASPFAFAGAFFAGALAGAGFAVRRAAACSRLASRRPVGAGFVVLLTSVIVIAHFLRALAVCHRYLQVYRHVNRCSPSLEFAECGPRHSQAAPRIAPTVRLLTAALACGVVPRPPVRGIG